jgi:hypothetical protein
MKDPKTEIEKLLKNPIQTAEGGLFINQMYKLKPSIQLDLNSFHSRPHGSLFMFSPEEWVRVIEIMRAYFSQEERKK